MRYAIVDIGSNTIRMNVYEIEKNNIKQLFSKKTVAGLSSYIQDGKLSTKGIQKATKVLSSYRYIAELLGAEKFLPFATASLRNITNADEAIAAINKYADVTIDLIQGRDEALYGFRGLTIGNDVDSGVLFDIGGGSTEVIHIVKGTVKRAESVPMGSLNSFTTLMKGLTPTRKEAAKIKKEFNARLDELNISKSREYDTLYGIGGTARACGNVCQEYFDLPNHREFTAGDLGKMIDALSEGDNRAIRTLLQVVPERIHTLTPGMLIIETLCERFSSKKVSVGKNGVREGYIVNYLVEEGVVDHACNLR